MSPIGYGKLGTLQAKERPRLVVFKPCGRLSGRKCPDSNMHLTVVCDTNARRASIHSGVMS
eukprot:1136595-Pelagomonas_calceolata.AAC.3